MKITWEHLIPVIITVGGGLLVWAVKIAINAIGKSIIRELRDEVARLKAEREALQRQVDNNSARIDFIFKTLIERNS